MQKTCSIRVDHTKLHPRYGKRFVMSKKYLVHDEAAIAKAGDKVLFEECRPLSRHKRWRLIKVLEAAKSALPVLADEIEVGKVV